MIDLIKKANIEMDKITEDLIKIQNDTVFRKDKNPHYYRVLNYLTKSIKPKVVVEFGTWKGVSAACLYDGWTFSKMITIDTVYQVIPDAKREGIDYRIFNSSVVDDIQEIDIAFIDVDHNYECTHMCLDMVRDKMVAGGIILFDDIFLNDDMKAFWNELNIGGKKIELPIHGDAGFGAVIFDR